VLPLPAAPILTGCAAVPFTITTCGEMGASSVTVIVEERMPAATGAKIIGFEQFAFAANVPTHVAVPSEKSFMLTPPGTMFVTCIGAFPVLVSSRFCGEEVIPTVTVPGMLNVPGGVKGATGVGVGGATLVPISGMICGLPGLSVIESVA
jgi:hypothetical protein